MMRKKRVCLKTGFVFVFCCIVCLFPLSTVAATRVVRAAVYNNAAFAYQDVNGVWRGMDVECLTNIAQHAGFKIAFIDSANDPDFLMNLENGTYDLVADVVKTPEREKRFLFGDQEQGVAITTLVVRADDDRWEYGGISQLSKMHIGVLSNYANNKDFRSWCVQRNVTPQIVDFPSIDQMNKALADGRIDGEVYGGLYVNEASESFRPILQFIPQAYYFVFRKDDVELKNMVDEAMVQIIVENPSYLSDLQNKYVGQFQKKQLPFNRDEKDFIAQHPVMKVAVLSDDAPYYVCRKDGVEKGILPDYYAILSRVSGLKFRFVQFDTTEEAFMAVHEGKVDILGVVSSDIVAASQFDLAVTSAYQSTDAVMLTKSGTNIDRVRSFSVVYRSKDAVQGMFGSEYNNIRMVPCDRVMECFRVLQNGGADAVISALPSATWLLNQTNASLYNITPISGITISYCGAVDSSQRVLRNILNKCIAGTKENFTSIVANNTLQENTWKTFIQRIPPTLIAVTVGVLLTFIMVLVWALVQLRARQKERTAVLAAQAETEQNRLKVEALRKNVEERNQFFSNISHDMRTPLNAVLGFAREAKRKDITSEQRDDYLGKVELSGKLLLNLINDTLTMSRINSNKLVLHPEPVSTEELVSSIAVPIQEATEAKAQSFRVDVAGLRGRTILADGLQLQKIFLNLLTNSVKYTPSGGHVSFLVKDDGPDTVFVVKDDGIGIAPDFLENHLFEPFAQEMENGHESSGTGLGLSIVKNLVTLMDGTIDVSSEVGKGTQFTVTLRFKEVDAGVSGKRLDRKPALAGPKLEGLRILVCEDNELNRQIVSMILQKRGMAVDTEADGKRGVARFSASRPGTYCAILMDIRMPVMDGYEASKAIRESVHADAKSIPIIALTADAFPDDIEKAKAAGMNGHVSKPIDPEKLFDVLSRCIVTCSSPE